MFGVDTMAVGEHNMLVQEYGLYQRCPRMAQWWLDN